MQMKNQVPLVKILMLSLCMIFPFSLYAILGSPLVIDEGQPKVVSSATATCNTTSYPLFLSTHLPMVTTAATSHWNQNKEGSCLERKRAQVLKELGQNIGPVVEFVLKEQEENKKPVCQQNQKK